ncbi:MAG: crossover junction endodeoxyribonuclease RuvC [Gemmatimonadota bacterium]|nr:MAG: crossover junction endodeoxyribonuclease RuvC [Gemmatimonadota bacterium]
MIVLGVDPGTRITGYGVVDGGDRGRPVLIECGVIRPASRSLPRRLLEILEGLDGVIERTRPDVLCVEGVFYGRNAQTTLKLGQARGAVMLAAARRGMSVTEYPPAEVKNVVVGSGRAGKRQVALMVQKHLALAEPPAPEDAADGVALALCHLFQSGLTAAASKGRGAGRKGID